MSTEPRFKFQLYCIFFLGKGIMWLGMTGRYIELICAWSVSSLYKSCLGILRRWERILSGTVCRAKFPGKQYLIGNRPSNTLNIIKSGTSWGPNGNLKAYNDIGDDCYLSAISHVSYTAKESEGMSKIAKRTTVSSSSAQFNECYIL